MLSACNPEHLEVLSEVFDKFGTDLLTPDVFNAWLEGLKELLEDVLYIFDSWASQGWIFALESMDHDGVTLLEHGVDVLNAALALLSDLAFVTSHN